MARHIHIHIHRAPAPTRDAPKPKADVSPLVAALLEAIAARQGKTGDAGFDESKVKRDEGGRFSAQQHTAAPEEHAKAAKEHGERAGLGGGERYNKEASLAHSEAARHHTLAAQTGKQLHAEMAHNATTKALSRSSLANRRDNIKPSQVPAKAPAPASAATPAPSTSKPTKATASGAKAATHELLSSGHPFSVDELMKATGCSNKSTLLTALSDLKSPKYAGKLGALSIKKNPDGTFQIEKKAEGERMVNAGQEHPALTAAKAEVAKNPRTMGPSKTTPVQSKGKTAREYVMGKERAKSTSGLYDDKTGSRAMVAEYSDHIHLTGLETPGKGQGQGGASRVMQQAIAKADEKGLPLVLRPEAAKPSDQARLEQFYEKLGFEKSDGGMIKQPGKKQEGSRTPPNIPNTVGLVSGQTPNANPIPPDIAARLAKLSPKINAQQAEGRANEKRALSNLGPDMPGYKIPAKPAESESPQWKPSLTMANMHRTELSTGHQASRTARNDGGHDYHVKGGGSNYEHSIRTDGEGNVVHHRLTTPTTTQSVKGPIAATSTKGLNPNQAAKFGSIYKALGIKRK